MVAVKASDIDRFIARPDPARPVVLVFGPDAGLVHERTQALISSAVKDPGDPFSLARLDGDDLAGEPTRLVEEANTIPLFGERRAVWVKAGSRNFAPAVEALLTAAPSHCRVVIEAGDLKRTSPLRTVCERAKNAATLPCYADAERELMRLIEEEMRASGLSVSPEARAALVPLLGGDRLASRHELRKLALFALGRGRVELDDVMAVVADASALTLENLIDAAFAGRTQELEVQFGKTRTAAITADRILSTAVRQVGQLHRARLALDEGASFDEAVATFQPFVHFSRKPLIDSILKAWTAIRLERAMAQLADAALEARRQSAVADLVAQRTMLVIAMAARRKD